MKKGFTLIEILLSISLIAIISGISIPIYNSFQIRNEINIMQSNIIESIRKAQMYSISGEGNLNSGVKIEADKVVLYRGVNYESRDISFDEVYILPSTLTPSGINEINFSRPYGIPSIFGDIILTSSINETKTININEKGFISF